MYRNLKYTQNTTQEEKDSYKKGYLMGYAAGYADGKSGEEKIKTAVQTVREIPLVCMGLSTRAYNCLSAQGCQCAGDVAELKTSRILQIRSLGKVTAGEIALALEKLEIHGTDWEAYL